MRIGYYIPAYRSSIHPMIAFQLAFGDMPAIIKAGHVVTPFWTDEVGVDHCCNHALEWARTNGFEWMIIQGSDLWAEKAPILELIQCGLDKGAAIVSAPVRLRRANRRLNVTPEPETSEPYEATSSGSGLIAIRIAEIDRIAEEYDGPWFARGYHDKRQTKVAITGDQYFTELIRAHGGRLVVHADIPTGHMHSVPLMYEPPTPTSGKEGSNADTA